MNFIIKARAVAGYAGIRKQIKISKIFFFNMGLTEFHYSKSNEIQHIHDHQVQLLQATQSHQASQRDAYQVSTLLPHH